jgi:putative tryptophan/tyrosine transport system substrate-binding protein
MLTDDRFGGQSGHGLKAASQLLTVAVIREHEIPQRSSLLPYRCMLSSLSKAREASGSEAARLHHAARRRGSVAAGDAGAAAGGAVVGFLHSASAASFTDLVAAFRKGLSEAGYVEGRNVAIEYRWADGHNERLPALAAELVGRRVDVLVTPVSTAATLAAKAATATIPIVFVIGADPVKIGLVASLNRPSGNATGISDIGVELGAKRLGLLHELLPNAARFGVLVNPDNPGITEPFLSELQTAASAIGRQLEVVAANTNSGIDTAFATLVKGRADAFLISPEALFVTRRVQLLTLAARHTLPALYHRREFTDAGGLMSYGSSLADQFRQTGISAGRILKGENPADMPVQLPTKFEFVINLQTAKTLGIDIPPMLLARADEVIE